jgi:hypothetical protein
VEADVSIEKENELMEVHMRLIAMWLALLASMWMSLGCNQQPATPPEAKQQGGPATAVGEVSQTAIDKAKAVEGTLQQSADRTAETVNPPPR